MCPGECGGHEDPQLAILFPADCWNANFAYMWCQMQSRNCGLNDYTEWPVGELHHSNHDGDKGGNQAMNKFKHMLCWEIQKGATG